MSSSARISPSSPASSSLPEGSPSAAVLVKKTERGLSSTESIRAVTFTSPGAPAVRRIVYVPSL